MVISRFLNNVSASNLSQISTTLPLALSIGIIRYLWYKSFNTSLTQLFYKEALLFSGQILSDGSFAIYLNI